MGGIRKLDRRALLRGSAALLASGIAGRASGLSTNGGQPAAKPANSPPPLDFGTLMAPGIPEALATDRARTLSNLRYEIRLDVTQRDSANGSVRILFDRRDRNDLILDFRGTSIEALRVNDRPLEFVEWRNGHVRVPAANLKAGKNVLDARFETPVGPSATALLRFDDTTDGTRYLYTVLVPAEAHLLFPCFDQPDLKARVRWTVDAPVGWTVIANSKVASKSTQGDVVSWTFNSTPPIPLYVASIAAGPWKSFPTGIAGQRPITLYTRASRAAEMDVEPFVATNRDTVEWLGRWLAAPFPFEKLDLVVVPAFPLGAMENIAAVFYGETRTLFREPPTLTQRISRNSMIYHELSHQWFGDYVTMRWFDDLWLKEGFATFMAAYLQAALQSATEPGKIAYVSWKPSAYNTDVSAGTTPLWQRLDNLNQAGSNYGPIVYNKAPSIIRQLAFLLGDDAFRRGLQIYVRKHAYGNATWRDLLAALEQASNTSLHQFGERWILQAGLPRVETRMEIADGTIRRLSLHQRPANDKFGTGPWPMRIQLRLGYRDRPDKVLPVRFTDEVAVIADVVGLPAPDYVWANDGDYGYGLFELDARSVAWLMDHVGEVKDNLVRALLWGALWEEVRECRLPALRYAQIAMDQLASESDEPVASFVLARAATAITHYSREEDAEPVYPDWEHFLAVRAADQRLSYGMRKDALDMLANTARTQTGLDGLRSYLSGKSLLDGQPVRQVTRWAIITQLLVRCATDADELYANEVARDKSPDSERSAFVALAAKADPATKSDYFRRYLEDKKLNENWAMASFSTFNNVSQNSLTTPYLRPALDQLEAVKASRSIAFLPNWISSFVKNRTSAQDLSVIDEFLTARPDLSIDIRRKLLEARDDVARTVRVRGLGSKAALSTWVGRPLHASSPGEYGRSWRSSAELPRDDASALCGRGQSD